MRVGPVQWCIGNRGVALVVVLWALTVISVIAANFTTVNRDGLFLARNAGERAKAEALADAGVYRALLAITSREVEPASGEGATATAEQSAGRADLLRARRVEPPAAADSDAAPEPLGENAPQPWRTDSTVYDWPVGDGGVFISIQDEAGKVDLNAAAEDLLLNLFRSVALSDLDAETLVDRLIDYRDTDQEARPLGAEDPDYERAGLNFGAKDKPFERPDELRRVLGITPDIYRQIAPMITVYSGSPGVDPNVAPVEVLGVLGAAGAAVDTAPSPTTASARARSDGRRPNRATSAASRRRSFTILAEGRTAGGGIFVRRAVVQLTGGRGQPFIFRQWEQARDRLNMATSHDSLP